MNPEQRRQFLAIVNRRAQPGSGSDPLLVREQTHRYGSPDLQFLVGRDLVLMKLAASRTQDLADISRMMGCADEDSIKTVRRILAQHRPQDMEDLESLIHLGKLELESPPGGP